MSVMMIALYELVIDFEIVACRFEEIALIFFLLVVGGWDMGGVVEFFIHVYIGGEDRSYIR